MRAADGVKDLMAAADPAAGVTGDPDRWRADLERILAGPGPGPRRPRRGRAPRLWVPLGAVAAACAAALALTLLPSGGGHAYAATPPPLDYRPPATAVPAAQELAEIARRTAARSEPDGGPDSVLEWRDWNLSTRVDGNTVTSRVLTEQHRALLHPDGTGTQSSRFDGRPERTEPYAAGLYRQPVPADPDALRALLRASTPAVDTPSGLAQALRGLLRTQVLDPGQRAAVLRLVAALPGLSYDGSVTDRAGRPGEAFSAESDGSGLPTRYTFVVDPDSGRILGDEATLTTRAGALNVPVPSVISYTAYLSARRQ
ncbi:CU044_5270 family protein [Kitasatospora sp. NA04385]|uniref:CU044_5270 family protein n=1 Tax=Kitasatospora sp. NA04385 TaxID=2742135 RepID=UPI001592A35D|nr:CU044_5270 family protein [Kitasatospora sp. NA04385]QKW22734.1 CU044_5270 family protein [Kitasatospora sp. NA04385]